MPQIFKALATITVWILWICSLLMGFGAMIIGIIAGDLFNPARPLDMSYPAIFAGAGFYAILAVVIMILRKKME